MKTERIGIFYAEKEQDVYYLNSPSFYPGQTDLENPRQKHRGPGVYYTGTAVPFKVMYAIEYTFYYHGSSRCKALPAGIYRVVDSNDLTALERLGDDYTPAQKTERDNYWAEKSHAHPALT